MAESVKAILLVDMPKSCGDCDYMADDGYCWIADTECNISWKYKRPAWCPIKPLPEKKDIKSILQYRGLAEQYRKEGWNECIDEILGETE